MRIKGPLYIFGILLVVLIINCQPPEPIPERPEEPAIMRDVHRVNDDGEFNEPYIPGNRTTMDGRISLIVQGQGTNWYFYLNAPEKLDRPVMTGPAGAQILGEPKPFHTGGVHQGKGAVYHHAICDATTEFPEKGEKPNPYSCGTDGKSDCYKLTIISTTREKNDWLRVWGVPVLVEVTNPKTTQARIHKITPSPAIKGGAISSQQGFNEPAVTEDGRLLSGRRGVLLPPWFWTNPNTGQTKFQSNDLIYSVLPEDAEPCDVTGWQDFHPISHAPFDSDMKDEDGVAKYGVAAYPFRDTEGNPIPDGEDIGGSYPWMDRQGANIFLTGVHGNLQQVDGARFPRRCVPGGVCSDSHETDYTRGLMVAGAWTHGKIVLLDSMLNHVDWSVPADPKEQYMVDLYKNKAGQNVSVRVGGGRKVGGWGELTPDGYTLNTNISDSIQNVFNYNQALRTITPRDVVWLMSTGIATDEVVFDDYLDPNAFIVSSMQASVVRNKPLVSSLLGLGVVLPFIKDGHGRRLVNANILQGNFYTGSYEDIHIQNAATSLAWNVPSYGVVAKNTGRMEPVAMGGIHGKGFWLTGNNSIRYNVPSQEQRIRDYPWYISIFVDPRPDELDRREATLITFPDNSSIRIKTTHQETSEIQYLRGSQVVAQIAIPADEGWRHLAWQVEPGLKIITLSVDGFAFDTRSFSERMFRMYSGTLVLGAVSSNTPSYRGWIDDFKVLIRRPSVEVACNHARGTLIAIDNNSAWSETANKYPQWSHNAVASSIRGDAEGATRFVCFKDYTGDYKAHLANIPEGTRGIREAIVFPEGPLVFGKPRPDSSQNNFCLSCHTNNGKGGLGLEALVHQPINMEYDHRRQPSQPPRRVFGNIPANWIPEGAGPGSPGSGFVAPPEGALIDRWILRNQTQPGDL